MSIYIYVLLVLWIYGDVIISNKETHSRFSKKKKVKVKEGRIGEL